MFSLDHLYNTKGSIIDNTSGTVTRILPTVSSQIKTSTQPHAHDDKQLHRHIPLHHFVPLVVKSTAISLDHLYNQAVDTIDSTYGTG